MTTPLSSAVERLEALIAKKRASLVHVEENRDGWFCTMPEDLIDADKAEIATLEDAVSALKARPGVEEVARTLFVSRGGSERFWMQYGVTRARSPIGVASELAAQCVKDAQAILALFPASLGGGAE